MPTDSQVVVSRTHMKRILRHLAYVQSVRTTTIDQEDVYLPC